MDYDKTKLEAYKAGLDKREKAFVAKFRDQMAALTDKKGNPLYSTKQIEKMISERRWADIPFMEAQKLPMAQAKTMERAMLEKELLDFDADLTVATDFKNWGTPGGPFAIEAKKKGIDVTLGDGTVVHYDTEADVQAAIKKGTLKPDEKAIMVNLDAATPAPIRVTEHQPFLSDLYNAPDPTDNADTILARGKNKPTRTFPGLRTTGPQTTRTEATLRNVLFNTGSAVDAAMTGANIDIDQVKWEENQKAAAAGQAMPHPDVTQAPPSKGAAQKFFAEGRQIGSKAIPAMAKLGARGLKLYGLGEAIGLTRTMADDPNDKPWDFSDPSGFLQAPFSMVQGVYGSGQALTQRMDESGKTTLALPVKAANALLGSILSVDETARAKAGAKQSNDLEKQKLMDEKYATEAKGIMGALGKVHPMSTKKAPIAGDFSIDDTYMSAINTPDAEFAGSGGVKSMVPRGSAVYYNLAGLTGGADDKDKGEKLAKELDLLAKGQKTSTNKTAGDIVNQAVVALKNSKSKIKIEDGVIPLGRNGKDSKVQYLAVNVDPAAGMNGWKIVKADTSTGEIMYGDRDVRGAQDKLKTTNEAASRMGPFDEKRLTAR